MIYLINMPFSSLFQPSLALGQFKAQLTDARIESRQLNLNFDFARKIGFDNYEPLEKLRGVDMRIGEWFFAREAWGEDFGPSPEKFLAECAKAFGALGPHNKPIDWLLRIRNESVPQFLEECCAKIFSGAKPQVVAFSCVFFQTIPALALARWIKNRSPATKTVLGGACLHSDMGRELIEKAEFIDAVSIGEADEVIVELMESYLNNRPPSGLNTIYFRNDQGVVEPSPSCDPVSEEALESMPDPDFDDYINDVESYDTEEESFSKPLVFLPFESSRGCWWGEKSQCAFCGLNAEGMNFRAKSPDKVFTMLENLANRYSVSRFFATDNNLPLNYYNDLLPRLNQSPLLKDKSFFYEIKTNVRREWIQTLSEAGVRFIQPGIETLSTHLLKCIRKGVTALKNVHLLKLCRLYGVIPMWNYLIRIPGERAEDYQSMVDLVGKIVHYYPPTGSTRPVQVHRFSPYFKEQGKYIKNVKAPEWYAGLFPQDRVDLDRIAYYFDADWKNTLGQEADDYKPIAGAVDNWIETWTKAHTLPGLSFDIMQSNQLDLDDTRNGKNGTWQLDSREGLLYRGIDDPATVEDICTRFGATAGTPDAVEKTLDNFVMNDLALEESGKYLALALPENVLPLPLKMRQEMFRRFNLRDTNHKPNHQATKHLGFKA